MAPAEAEAEAGPAAAAPVAPTEAPAAAPAPRADRPRRRRAHAFGQEAGQRLDGRMIVQHRGREAAGQVLLELHAQVDAEQRIEAEVEHAGAIVERVGAVEQLADGGLEVALQARRARRRIEAGEPRQQRRAGRAGGAPLDARGRGRNRHAGLGLDQLGQQRAQPRHALLPGQRGEPHRDQGEIAVAMRELAGDHLGALLRRNQTDRRLGARLGLASGHPAARPTGPADRQARQPEAAAIGGEAVEEGVGGRVVGLPRVAEQRGRRGIQHEEIEHVLAQRVMQVQGARHLGGEHRAVALPVLLVEHAVVQAARRMHHALERRQRAQAFGQARQEAVALAHVGRQRRQSHAHLAQARQRRVALGAGRVAAHQHQMARALPRQRGGRLDAELAVAARDQVAGLGIDHRRRRRQRRCAPQPRHQQAGAAHRVLRLLAVRVQRPHQQRGVRAAVAAVGIEIDQARRAALFVDEAGHQPPGQRGQRRTHARAAGRLAAAREEMQRQFAPARRERGLAEPQRALRAARQRRVGHRVVPGHLRLRIEIVERPAVDHAVQAAIGRRAIEQRAEARRVGRRGLAAEHRDAVSARGQHRRQRRAGAAAVVEQQPVARVAFGRRGRGRARRGRHPVPLVEPVGPVLGGGRDGARVARGLEAVDAHHRLALHVDDRQPGMLAAAPALVGQHLDAAPDQLGQRPEQVDAAHRGRNQQLAAGIGRRGRGNRLQAGVEQDRVGAVAVQRLVDARRQRDLGQRAAGAARQLEDALEVGLVFEPDLGDRVIVAAHRHRFGAGRAPGGRIDGGRRIDRGGLVGPDARPRVQRPARRAARPAMQLDAPVGGPQVAVEFERLVAEHAAVRQLQLVDQQRLAGPAFAAGRGDQVELRAGRQHDLAEDAVRGQVGQRLERDLAREVARARGAREQAAQHRVVDRLRGQPGGQRRQARRRAAGATDGGRQRRVERIPPVGPHALALERITGLALAARRPRLEQLRPAHRQPRHVGLREKGLERPGRVAIGAAVDPAEQALVGRIAESQREARAQLDHHALRVLGPGLVVERGRLGRRRAAVAQPRSGQLARAALADELAARAARLEAGRQRLAGREAQRRVPVEQARDGRRQVLAGATAAHAGRLQAEVDQQLRERPAVHCMRQRRVGRQAGVATRAEPRERGGAVRHPRRETRPGLLDPLAIEAGPCVQGAGHAPVDIGRAADHPLGRAGFRHRLARIAAGHVEVFAQAGAQVVECLEAQRDPAGGLAAAHRGRVAERGRIDPGLPRPCLVEPVEVAARVVGQRGARMRGEPEHLRRGVRFDVHVGGIVMRRVGLDDQVRIGAAEAERADARQRAVPARASPSSRRRCAAARGRRDLRIEGLEMQVPRHHAMAHHLDRLVQAADAGGRFHVAEIGLQRAHHSGARSPASST